MAHASVALAHARTLLNDDAAATWSDAALMPMLQVAHQELQTALWEVGSPVVREESSLLGVIAHAAAITTPPTDMIAPLKLYEYTDGSALVGEMTEVFYLPKGISEGHFLVYWCWRNEAISFLGADLATKVVVQYRKLITVPTLVTSELGMVFAELYCGPRVAALAAGSVGNAEVLKAASDMATENFAKILAANRGQQKPSNRP